MRLKLVVAYDGRPFQGWQRQAKADTVQGTIERAIEKIASAPVALHGAGRTDAGVHALGQVAHADVPERPPQTWLRALNANLPPEIRILKCQVAPAAFHARYSAKAKVYRYRIWCGPILPPVELGRCWHVPAAIDIGAVRACAKLFVGRHDFAAFAANRGKPDESTVRAIRRVDVRKRGHQIAVEFEGDGFLYKMVRLITGALVRCGTGRMDAGSIRALLGGSAGKNNHIAPAEGLFLVRVIYPTMRG